MKAGDKTTMYEVPIGAKVKIISVEKSPLINYEQETSLIGMTGVVTNVLDMQFSQLEPFTVEMEILKGLASNSVVPAVKGLITDEPISFIDKNNTVGLSDHEILIGKDSLVEILELKEVK